MGRVKNTKKKTQTKVVQCIFFGQIKKTTLGNNKNYSLVSA